MKTYVNIKHGSTPVFVSHGPSWANLLISLEQIHQLQPRHLSKIANYVLDLDTARVLYARNFDTDNVDALIEKIKLKKVYSSRSKSIYDKMFEKDVTVLHKEACAIKKIMFSYSLKMMFSPDKNWFP